MTPTYIYCALILPGLYMEDSRPPNVSEFELYDESQSGGFAFVDNESISIYSVERDEVIKLEDIKVSKDSYLEETLFILRSVMGIEFEMDNHARSQSNWISDGDYNDMLGDKENMRALYEIVNGNYQLELINSQEFNAHGSRYCQMGYGQHIGPIKTSFHEDKLFTCSFIGLWQVHTSQGFEDLYPELDAIEFIGEGKVSLIE